MSSVTVPDEPVQSVPLAVADGARWMHRFVLLSIWLLPIMGFTMPQVQVSDAWNALDSTKLLILAFACFGGAAMFAMNLSHPKFPAVIGPLLPFFVFLGWAILSIAWSPLKSVSTAQSGGLVAMLFLSTTVGLLCTRPAKVTEVLLHLNLMLLACSSVAMVAYLIDPEMSGLDRTRIHTGGDGLIHPTAAGATASLGVLLPVVCYMTLRFRWAGYLLAPCVLVHGGVLLFSNSRTAIVLAVVTIGAVLFRHSSNQRRAMAMFAFSLLCLAALLLDPGFEAASSLLGAGAEFVSRGQSSDQLREVSGRSEMWSAIWAQYQKSLMLGHGYFVSSETGSLLVWNERHNYTAHNLVLQILVSTGAIGLLMFANALLQPLLVMLPLRRADQFSRRIFGLLMIAVVWFFGWSLVGDAFMGPVRAESVLFFSLLGIGVGQATHLIARSPREAMGQAPSASNP